MLFKRNLLRQRQDLVHLASVTDNAQTDLIWHTTQFTLHILLFNNMTNSTTLHKRWNGYNLRSQRNLTTWQYTSILHEVVQNIRLHFATRKKIMINNVCRSRPGQIRNNN